VRYIGNKTRLLEFIIGVLRRRGIDGGTAVDPFTGTASVARELKRQGFQVLAADIMEYAYVFGRAYVAAGRPRLSGLASAVGPDPDLDDVVRHLNHLPGEPGFIHRHFTPDGDVGARYGRMYFTPDNAARIDTVRATIQRWHDDGRIDDDAFHLLLAALIEAADRVANTTGVYASFVKTWQPNALRTLRLETPEIVHGNGCEARRTDALELLRELRPFDLLYLDPPYNTRQYPGYYHIPEIIAVGWFDGGHRLRGKTGLMPDDDRRSDWSRQGRCEEAFEELVATARWTHLVMSYNGEGIIPEPTIRRVLEEHGRKGTYKRYRQPYKRYRSDSDGENRTYSGDRVHEYLYCVDR